MWLRLPILHAFGENLALMIFEYVKLLSKMGFKDSREVCKKHKVPFNLEMYLVVFSTSFTLQGVSSSFRAWALMNFPLS